MKRLSKLLLVSVLSVVLVTGCKMKTSMEFNIDKENTNINLIMAFDDEFIDTMLAYQENPDAISGDPATTTVPTHTDEERWAYIESGSWTSMGDVSDDYKPERYEKDGFKGYSYSIPVGKLDDISSETATERVDLSQLFNGSEINDDAVLFIKNGNTYTSNMSYTVSNDTTGMEGVSAEQMAEAFDISISFNLPSEAAANNATTVSADKKKLTYSLLETKNIDFSFTLDDGKAVVPTNTSTESSKKDVLSDKMVYAIVGVVCLLAIAVVIIIILTRGKKNNATVNNVSINTPVTPVDQTTPVTPVAPVDQTTPVTPVAPSVTDTPVVNNDFAANDVVTPVVNEAPVTPVVPSEPVVPTVPVTPVEPTVPVTPVTPVEPVTPVVPTEPTIPVTPSAPVMPSAPEMNVNNTPVDNSPVDNNPNNFNL
jgi:hypothetical protein